MEAESRTMVEVGKMERRWPKFTRLQRCRMNKSGELNVPYDDYSYYCIEYYKVATKVDFRCSDHKKKKYMKRWIC